mmetsp:Transcript_53555/g.148917  ORF Transcript_53555/g.148917 Transcript_53555/m.148917 type:complete len:121 (+) Transcript_53555:784-1146(+)
MAWQASNPPLQARPEGLRKADDCKHHQAEQCWVIQARLGCEQTSFCLFNQARLCFEHAAQTSFCWIIQVCFEHKLQAGFGFVHATQTRLYRQCCWQGSRGQTAAELFDSQHTLVYVRTLV